MAVFDTFEAAIQFVWALPLGVGKIFSVGGGGYLVGIIGKHFLSDVKKEE